MKKRFNPPAYLFIILILEIIFYFIFPIGKFIKYPYNYIGVVIIVIGVLINLWGDWIFKKEKTTIKPDEKSDKIIDYGIFRISRNPMYLGMFMILFGIAIVLGNVLSFIFPIVFIMIIEKLFIPIEEKNMEKRFGKRYLQYKSKVRRWI